MGTSPYKKQLEELSDKIVEATLKWDGCFDGKVKFLESLGLEMPSLKRTYKVVINVTIDSEGLKNMRTHPYASVEDAYEAAIDSAVDEFELEIEDALTGYLHPPTNGSDNELDFGTDVSYRIEDITK